MQNYNDEESRSTMLSWENSQTTLDIPLHHSAATRDPQGDLTSRSTSRLWTSGLKSMQGQIKTNTEFSNNRFIGSSLYPPVALCYDWEDATGRLPSGRGWTQGVAGLGWLGELVWSA